MSNKSYGNIIVTGGAGYIGDAVIQNLLENFKVIVVDNLMYGGAYMRGVGNTNLHFINMDVTKNLRPLFEKFKPKVVVHLAAIVGDSACAVNPERTTEVNEVATKNIAELCKEFGTKMVFASTCSVYGANNEILNEDSDTNPLSLYAGTKLNAEKFVREVQDHIIFRLGTLFGLSTEHARIRCDLVVNILTYKAMQGNNLTVFGGDQWRPLLHVLDAGRIFAQAAKSRYIGTYILSHKNYKIIDLANQIRMTCSPVVAVGMDVTESKFEDLRNYKVDTSKLENETVLRTMIDLDEGIADMRDVMMQGRIADVWNTSFHNGKYIKEVLNG